LTGIFPHRESRIDDQALATAKRFLIQKKAPSLRGFI
jgi:hypothetical protein